MDAKKLFSVTPIDPPVSTVTEEVDAIIANEYPDLVTETTEKDGHVIIDGIENAIKPAVSEEDEIPEDLVNLTREDLIKDFIKRTNTPDIVSYVRRRVAIYYQKEIEALREQLYDKDADPTMVRNVAMADAYGEIRGFVKGKLDGFIKSAGFVEVDSGTFLSQEEIIDLFADILDHLDKRTDRIKGV